MDQRWIEIMHENNDSNASDEYGRSNEENERASTRFVSEHRFAVDEENGEHDAHADAPNDQALLNCSRCVLSSWSAAVNPTATATTASIA